MGLWHLAVAGQFGAVSPQATYQWTYTDWIDPGVAYPLFKVRTDWHLDKKDGRVGMHTQQLFIPRHPVIPPEVRCFRYVFGVQIPSQEVFGCLGYWSGSFFLKGHVNFQGGCLVIALWIYGRNPAKLIEIPWFTRFFTSTRWLFVWDFWIINRMEFRGKFGRRPLEERGFHHGGDQHFLFLLAAGSISKGPSIQINDICFLVRNILSEVEPNLLQ